MGTSAQALPSTMSLVDLLNPDPLQEAQKHKLKRLVQSPNSFFMDVKCPGCYNITPVFSHAQTVVMCGSCNMTLCQPTGGKARLTEDALSGRRSTTEGVRRRGRCFRKSLG